LNSGRNVDEVKVIVVLDDCHDATPAIVARFAANPHVQAITSTAHRVGAARRQGVDGAMTALIPTERLWLANTDADSTVPLDWLTRMVDAANTGIQTVLGTVLPDLELRPPQRARWLAQHQLHEGHPHVHGANFGIRADAYLALGGWRDDLACDEDVDLTQRATAAGFAILRTAEIPVITSARTVGQAPNGFSSYLRRLHAETGGVGAARPAFSV
jgi:GT2 family glycosyltransferase